MLGIPVKVSASASTVGPLSRASGLAEGDRAGTELRSPQPPADVTGEFCTKENAGVPILEMVKSEDGNVTIFEADDMDNRLQFPVSMIGTLIQQLGTLT
jgi:hypothetical protein